MSVRTDPPADGASGSAVAYRQEDLAILFETIQDLTSTLSTREVIQRLLDRVLSHLESEIASILLLGPDQMLRIRHASGLPEEVLSTAELKMGEGIAGYVASTGKPVLVHDVESDPRFRKRNHERYYTRSAVSAPLRAHGEVIGVINVNNKRSREPYTADDMRLIEAIAGHAVVALSNAHRYEETLERARRDALTGLANHGHFWSTLELELERARRYGRQVGLAMIDVDHFKAVNDRHGHICGDQVLAGVARVIEQTSRAHDSAARYGGEEFAVILPETALSGVACFAEKIRAAVEASSFGPGAEGEMTVSAGVAVYPEDAGTAGELVAVADRRLYGAKALGRNQVHEEG